MEIVRKITKRKIMRAFNTSTDLKETLITKAKQHPSCTIFDINPTKNVFRNVNDHAFLAMQLDIPKFIIHLQDCIFKFLEVDLRNHWTERLLTSIPVGADLTPVLPVLLLSLLDALPPQKRIVKSAIEKVKEIMVKWIETGHVDKQAIEAAIPTVTWATRVAEKEEEATEAIAIEAAIGAAQATTWAVTSTERRAWAAEAIARSVQVVTQAATQSVAKTEAEAATGATRQAIWTAAIEATWADTADNLILSIQTTTNGVRQ